MGDLQELIDRATIEFPEPIDEEHVREVLSYLSESIEGTSIVKYNFKGEGHIRTHPQVRERYLLEISGTITAQELFTMVGFLLRSDKVAHPGKFASMKFDILVPGYNSVEEFETLPSGKGQLELIDKIKIYTEEYFSQNSQQ